MFVPKNTIEPIFLLRLIFQGHATWNFDKNLFFYFFVKENGEKIKKFLSKLFLIWVVLHKNVFAVVIFLLCSTLENHSVFMSIFERLGLVRARGLMQGNRLDVFNLFTIITVKSAPRVETKPLTPCQTYYAILFYFNGKISHVDRITILDIYDLHHGAKCWFNCQATNPKTKLCKNSVKCCKNG